MKTYTSSLVAAIIVVVSQGVLAQASSPTRAEVRAQIKTSTLMPNGERATLDQRETSVRPGKTRADRKNETAMAREAGALRPAGEASDAKEEKADLIKASGANRADRKADASAAIKARTTQPAGEATQPSAERAGK